MTDRPDLEDLDAESSDGPWCCNGNAEDCALCTDPNPPYPFLCPGHPRTAANERIVGEATQATALDATRSYLRSVTGYGTAEDSLREQVRAALAVAGVSQAAVARELGLSTKHMSQMLTGRVPLSLEWAERILAVCGRRVEVFVLKGEAR